MDDKMITLEVTAKEDNQTFTCRMYYTRSLAQIVDELADYAAEIALRPEITSTSFQMRAIAADGEVIVNESLGW